MRGRAVVALEEVLGGDLPVAVVLGLARWRKRSASRSMPASAIRSGMPSRKSSSGAASRSGLTKTSGPQVSSWSCTRPSSSASIPPSLLPRGAGEQAAVEAVRPGVVRALERLAPARALADDRAAVPADVEERAQHVLLVADEDDRDVADARRCEGAGLGDLADGRRTATSGGRSARARAASTAGSVYQLHGSVRRRRRSRPRTLASRVRRRRAQLGVEPREVDRARRAEVVDDRGLRRAARQQRLPAGRWPGRWKSPDATAGARPPRPSRRAACG